MKMINLFPLVKRASNNFIGILCLIFSGSSLASVPLNADYIQWKAQQHSYDQRLKARQHTDDRHYLSRPSLSTNADKISINSANAEQLQQLHGIGIKKAQAIVEYRQKNGKFRSIQDLQMVKGIGPVLFEKNKNRLML